MILSNYETIPSSVHDIYIVKDCAAATRCTSAPIYNIEQGSNFAQISSYGEYLYNVLSAGGTKLASYFSGEYTVENKGVWDPNVGFAGPALVFARNVNGSSDGNLYICGYKGHSYQVIQSVFTGLGVYFYSDGSKILRVYNDTGATITVYMSAIKL